MTTEELLRLALDQIEMDDETREHVEAVIEIAAGPVEDALSEALGDGLDLDEAKDLVVAAVDAALPFHALLPTLIANVLEEHDGPAIRALLDWLDDLFRRDPDKMRARALRLASDAAGLEDTKPKKSERMLRRSERVSDRADRVEARQE